MFVRYITDIKRPQAPVCGLKLQPALPSGIRALVATNQHRIRDLALNNLRRVFEYEHSRYSDARQRADVHRLA